MAASVKTSLNLSNEPKEALIASSTPPSGVPVLPGAITCQKKLWFHTPPALLRNLVLYAPMPASNAASSATATASSVRAALAFFT